MTSEILRFGYGETDLGIIVVAEGARGVAEGARGVAEGARGVAEGARGVAEGARGVAEGARGVAEGARGVAEDARGIVALFMGDDRDTLRRELGAAFPGASLELDEAGMAETVGKAVALVEAPHLGTDMALDLRGSAVEMAVWEALRKIPSGETRSYGDIARGLAVTAQDVGAACAANRVAIAVPCHRVVKADGSISGYRWGVRRKRRLINREGVA